VLVYELLEAIDLAVVKPRDTEMFRWFAEIDVGFMLAGYDFEMIANRLRQLLEFGFHLVQPGPGCVIGGKGRIVVLAA
jgi:hypothetical protein